MNASELHPVRRINIGEDSGEGEGKFKMVAQPKEENVRVYENLVDRYRACEEEVVRLCGT